MVKVPVHLQRKNEKLSYPSRDSNLRAIRVTVTATANEYLRCANTSPMKQHKQQTAEGKFSSSGGINSVRKTSNVSLQQSKFLSEENARTNR